MFYKKIIILSFFLSIVLLCISCLDNKFKKEYKPLYTILPTDSSEFTISLDGIETIKIPRFNLDGKWELVGAAEQKTTPLYLTFEGRKIHFTLNSDNSNEQQCEQEHKHKVFAIYDKCPNEKGRYNKKGQFLVLGSGEERLTCYKVISFEENKMTLYDVDKGVELKFIKIK